MRVFVCPGTFDPLTNGHVDVIRRAKHLCDELIVLVLPNAEKTPCVSLDERAAMVKLVFAGAEDIMVDTYDGLLVDYVRDHRVDAVVRGIRNEGDFAYENVMAAANRAMYPYFETIFLAANGAMAYMSSSIVRQVARFGGRIEHMVPAVLQASIALRYGPEDPDLEENDESKTT
jgi:pantetheine-phosphate adenylyltransferase